MKWMKRVLAMAAAGVLLLSVLTGCGSSGTSKNDVILDVVNDMRKERGAGSITEDTALSDKAKKVVDLFAAKGNSVPQNDFDELVGSFIPEGYDLWTLGIEWPEDDENNADHTNCRLHLYADSLTEKGYTDKYMIYQMLAWDEEDMQDNWLIRPETKKAGFATKKINGKTYWIALVLIPSQS